jgi:hypothetical protein
LICKQLNYPPHTAAWWTEKPPFLGASETNFLDLRGVLNECRFFSHAGAGDSILTTVSSYTKMFHSILTSTIWLEADRTRLVWITMLALADRNGEVQASVPGLARQAGVPLEDCQQAIGCLLAPDAHSRTKTADGRRIEPIDGGWVLINHAKYRDMGSRDECRSAAAIRQKRFRERHAGVTKRYEALQVTASNGSLASVTDTLHIAEADTDTKNTSSCPTSALPPLDGMEVKAQKKERPERHENPEAERFVDWFLALLAETGSAKLELTASVRYGWAEAYDRLVRLDGRTKEEIKAVCRWARNDDFWRTNFMAPPKLREKKHGVPYFDLLSNKMNNPQRGGAPAPAAVRVGL